MHSPLSQNEGSEPTDGFGYEGLLTVDAMHEAGVGHYEMRYYNDGNGSHDLGEPGLFTNSFQIGDCTSRKRRMLVALVYRGIRRRRRATAPSPNSYFIAMGRVKSEELHSGERGLEAA